LEDRISLQNEKVKRQEYRKKPEKTIEETYLQKLPSTNYLNMLFKQTDRDYGVVPKGKKKRKKKPEHSQGL